MSERAPLADEKGGIRRRCWWCGVVLRWWQLNSCRRCKRALVALYVGPPCRSRSRWDAAPDRFASPGERGSAEGGDQP